MLLRENDGIGVEVQHLLGVQLTQPLMVEFKSGPTIGEAGREDVDVDLHGIFVLDVFVDDLDHFVVHDEKGLKFFSVVV